MYYCKKPGCTMGGIPSSIPLKDMTKGSTRTVNTDASLLGAKPKMIDKTGMNSKPLNVKHPLNGKG